MRDLQKCLKTETCKLYRPLPFWSWNDKLEPEKLVAQLRWLEEKGTGGAFMHARSGLLTEYLSEEWMECVKACADESEKLGVQAWIYDENGWPSGFVGGKLLEEAENCDQYLEYTIGSFEEDADINYLLTEEELIRVEGQNTEGEYLNIFIHTSVSTVDILNPEVVDKFLNLTHEKYREYFGEAFEKQIEGFFTDEPQYYRWAMPYTRMMPVYYREHYGEDIYDQLGLLFVKKKGYRTFRYRYWKGMQALMLENFAKRYYTWCEEHHVKLTGHYIEELHLKGQMICCAGIMPFYQYEHIPGIDWLGSETESEIPGRQVASVAAQMGKKQVITETFGVGGWDITPADLRRIAGFQYVNGVNMICHHLVPYSERGIRKYDYPAHYADINPWVKEDFRTFNDYYTHLGYLLGEGDKAVNVAMLHPIRSAYFEYQWERPGTNGNLVELQEDWQNACRTLSSHGIDYHFLDETLLAEHGFVKGNKIGCGECSYDYLVIPSIYTMDCTTQCLIAQYVAQGGKILLLGDRPEYLEGEPYSYDYLESNVTLEEICASQPYQVKNKQTFIYSTYRVFEGRKFLFVMNSSKSESYTQTFYCGENVRSFYRMNLTDMTQVQVPLTITLHPGEDALLFFCEEEVQQQKALTPYQLVFEQADVSVKENYMTIDKIYFSQDGKTWSKQLPWEYVFSKLIEEKYQGEIYFRYDFEVRQLPETLYLRVEKSRDLGAWFNGILLDETVPAEEDYVKLYDVRSLVREGINSYVAKVDWYEHERVNYAWFSENVQESIRNCLVYDTELQPIELVGSFGVYPISGYEADAEDEWFVRAEDFYIAALPTKVSDPCIEGFPFFAGEMILRQKISLEDTDVLLQVEGDYLTATVKVNGICAGELFFEKELDISHVAKVGENDIEVRLILSNRNRMGPHHASGDRPSAPIIFHTIATWEGETSSLYHDGCDVKRFKLWGTLEKLGDNKEGKV